MKQIIEVVAAYATLKDEYSIKEIEDVIETIKRLYSPGFHSVKLKIEDKSIKVVGTREETQQEYDCRLFFEKCEQQQNELKELQRLKEKYKDQE